LCHPAIQPYMAIFLSLSAPKDECPKNRNIPAVPVF